MVVLLRPLCINAAAALLCPPSAPIPTFLVTGRAAGDRRWRSVRASAGGGGWLSGLLGAKGGGGAPTALTVTPGTVKAGDPVLHEPAQEVNPGDLSSEKVQDIIDQMIAVMRKAPGVGLAAPQIGVPLKIIVLEDTQEFISYAPKKVIDAQDRRPFDLLVIINPKLKKTSRRTACFYEGCLRMETLKLKKPSGRAKLTGTLVGLGGAMLLTFYKGPEIKFLRNLGHTGLSHAHGSHQQLRPPPAEGSRILGSFLAITSCFSYAIWLTIQAKVGQVYPCHYSIAAMVCLFGAVQSTLLALCLHRDTDHWRLGLNIRLYSSAYAGIVASGSAFPLMSWCLRKKGPLYVAMFGPLIVVFVAVMSSIVLDETLHIGIVLGAVLIVAGLYMVLWGKAREEDEQEADEPKAKGVGQDEELGKETTAGNGET